MVCSIVELCKKLREVSPSVHNATPSVHNATPSVHNATPGDFAAGMESLRGMLSPDIKAKQEPDDMCGQSTTRRVLLTTNKSAARSPLARMCNGLILEWPSWNVLAIPPPILQPLAAIGRNYDMNEFVIYEIKDGTTVTLYWYNDRWCMGSANGIDISNYTWFDPATTYRAALDEVLATYRGFDWAALDKTKCYTIGFRHNKFHPLIADPPAAWNIRHHNLASLTIVTEPIGIPEQIPVSLGRRDKNTMIRWIHTKNQAAWRNYTVTGASPRRREVGTARHIHYGFIFCAPDRSYVLESTLQKQINTLIYDIPKATEWTPVARFEYILLRAALCSKGEFLRLFPQYSGRIAAYDTMFGNLVSKTYTMISKQSPAAEVTAPLPAQNMDDLALQLAHIWHSTGISIAGPYSYEVVRDFVIDKKWLQLYRSVPLLVGGAA